MFGRWMDSERMPVALPTDELLMSSHSWPMDARHVLAHGMSDDVLSREGKSQAESAVRLDPESAILHYDLSLYMGASRETGAAYREQWTAHVLFPLKKDYALPQAVPDGRSDP